MRPDWVIPAVSALNLAEPGAGYRRGLRTGANLVTINLTPPDLREDYLLYKRDRFIMTEERILNAVAAEGLTNSTQSLADFYSAQGAVQQFRRSQARTGDRRRLIKSAEIGACYGLGFITGLAGISGIAGAGPGF